MGKAARIAIALVVGLALVVAAATWYLLGTRTGQDLVLKRVAAGAFASATPVEYDGLRVFP